MVARIFAVSTAGRCGTTITDVTIRSFDVDAAMNVAAVSCSSRSARGARRELAEFGIRIARGDARRDHHVIADRDVVKAQHLRLLWRCGRGCRGRSGVRWWARCNRSAFVPPRWAELPVARTPIAHDAAASGNQGSERRGFRHPYRHARLPDRSREHDGGRQRRRGQRLCHLRRRRSPDRAGARRTRLPLHRERHLHPARRPASASTPSPRWRSSPAARSGSSC